MSVPEIASLMPFYTLSKGQQVRFTALDASSGATVSAVVISEMVIGTKQQASLGDTGITPTPLLVPAEV